MASKRTIPSLDGLRAFSVLLVLLAHRDQDVFDKLHLPSLLRNGSLGVRVFFVISGFLITTLLLRDSDRSGRIHLKDFYIRRFFRIFPPFYVFLFVVAVLRLFHVYHFDWSCLVMAGTYTWNYTAHNDGWRSWVLGHTWSLSLEEQFYLIWPLCLVFFSKRRCLFLAGLTIVLAPVSRVVTLLLFPSTVGRIETMLHTSVDQIMVGSFLALALHEGLFSKFFAGLRKPVWLIPIFGYLLLVDPFLNARFGLRYMFLLGMTLSGLCCAALLYHATHQTDSVMGRVLNVPWIKHFGMISYSIYLWQQLFSGSESGRVPYDWLWILLCAEASYWFIERPSFKLRDKLLAPKSADAKADVMLELQHVRPVA